MNADKFNSYLDNPKSLDTNSANDLSSLIEQYPYFQTAHLLYLKILHIQKSVHYSSQLKIAASYANNRKKLYQLVIQEDLHDQIKVVEELTDKQENKTKKSDISPLEEQILQAAINASIQLEVKKETYHGHPKEKAQDNNEEAEKPTNVIEESIQDDESPRSFNQWLKSFNQEVRPRKEQGTEDEDALQSADIINKFIQDKPRIGDPSSASPKGDTYPFFSPIETAKLGLIDDESFVTETLAKIYEAQGFNLKAKTAYEMLSLKFPEKKATFAPRIKSLESLIQAMAKGKK